MSERPCNQENTMLNAIDSTFEGSGLPPISKEQLYVNLRDDGVPHEVIIDYHIPEFVSWQERNSKPALLGQTEPKSPANPRKRLNSQRSHTQSTILPLNISLGTNCKPENRIYGDDRYAPDTSHHPIEPESPI